MGEAVSKLVPLIFPQIHFPQIERVKGVDLPLDYVGFYVGPCIVKSLYLNELLIKLGIDKKQTEKV